MTDAYKNFRHVAANGDQYLIEHYPSVEGGPNGNSFFLTAMQEPLPARDVVRLEAVSGRTPERGSVGRILRGVDKDTIVGVAFNAASNQVIGMEFAARNWPRDESRKDEMYANGREYKDGQQPSEQVPENMQLALQAARDQWRKDI